MKLLEREEARRLRRDKGLSIKAIASAVGAAPSTVGRWVADVELTAEQLAALRAANPIFNRQRSGTAQSSANARARRIAAQEHGRAMAAVGDPLHRTGCMLYWAEGARNRNQLIFTNSDPEMLEVFLEFLRRCYAVQAVGIALSVNVHLGNGMTLAEIEAWWVERLGLPRSCLRQAAVNQVSRASQRKRRTLPYGTVRVVVCSTFIVQSIYGAIQAYGGFERSAWLG